MAELSRIQRKNRSALMQAGLEVFSEMGFRGATLDRIAEAAGMSRPNLLYYFPSKAAIHAALLEDLLDVWLAPLRAFDPSGDPVEEVIAYVRRKLELSRDFPRESKLFANEVMQGAPRIGDSLDTELKGLVDGVAAILDGWMAEGWLARRDPHHLIFSVWALTQHYADFDAQIAAVLGPRDAFAEADTFLTEFFRAGVRP